MVELDIELRSQYGCLDGDQDNVQSTNRGDGRDFQSTRIDSVRIDNIARSITLTGAGVSRGLPVTFVFVAIETGPTTPGLGQLHLQRRLFQRWHSDQRQHTATLGNPRLLET